MLTTVIKRWYNRITDMKFRIPFVYPIVFFIITFIFFSPFFLSGKLPIPSDTIIGLYHPYRDLYASEYPNGIPYKNFLITDPVRQQYPWRQLAIEQEKAGELPLWNPYSFAGTPLLGNFQSAAVYPLNVFFWIFPFAFSWSLLIILQPLLAGLFLFLYLRHMRLSPLAALFGGITFAFSGFSVVWMEWGTIVQTALWLPLILLSIDKLESRTRDQESGIKSVLLWVFIVLFALSSSFFAGHLQTFFYLSVLSSVYFFARWWQFGRSKKTFLFFLILASCFFLLTAVQWIPTLQLIDLSARSIDQANWQQVEGWFVPWQHLIQFVAPDFFGNPTTLNYWGTWNYGELIGYVGIAPLILGLYALFFRRDKKTFFFGTLFFLSLLFVLPTFLAKLPYQLELPFLSTAQPTRLLFVTDFTLSILAALGIDWYLRHKKRITIIVPVCFVIFVFLGLWIFILTAAGDDIVVAKRNLYLPTFLVGSVSLLFIVGVFLKKRILLMGLVGLLLFITIFDLIRFGQKFTPFTDPAYLFPSTKVIEFLHRDTTPYRIMTTDQRILPPNFSSVYHMQSIGGYDPLYMQRYAELIAASERGKPDIQPPFGFNRIISPTNIDSPVIDLLGVSYVLSFSELSEPRFTKVYEEGQTKVYYNNSVMPRAFFVEKMIVAKTKQEAIDLLFSEDLSKVAIVENPALSLDGVVVKGEATITEYTASRVIVNTESRTPGFLVLTDSYYPTWDVKVCNNDNEFQCTRLAIHLTDYQFRGVFVPAGKHSVIFENSLL